MTANEVQEVRAAIDRATAQDAPLHAVLHLLVDHLAQASLPARAAVLSTLSDELHSAEEELSHAN